MRTTETAWHIASAGLALALVYGTALPAWADGGPIQPSSPTVWNVAGHNADGTPTLEWRAQAAGILGFRWEQFDPVTGRARPLAPSLIPARPSAGATLYRLADPLASLKGAGWYRVGILDNRGGVHVLGPFEVEFSSAAPPVPSPAVAIMSEPQPPSPAALTEGDAIKINIREDGLYHLTASNIADCLSSLDYTSAVAAVAQTNLALTHMGAPVAWTPAVSNDGIVFYAQAIDSIYSRDNVYLLAPGTGVVMEVDVQTGYVAAVSNQWFVDTLHVEEDIFSYPQRYSDPEADIWLGPILFFPSYAYIPGYEAYHYDKSFPFRLHDPVPGETNGLSLTVRMLGDSTDDAVPGFDHDITASFTNGGGVVGSAHAAWNGTASATLDLAITGTVAVAEGTNWLRLFSSPTGASYAIEYVMDFDVTYPRFYRVFGGALVLESAAHTSVTVEGLGTGAVWIADVSSPLAPVLVQATNAVTGPLGDTWITFAAPGSNRTFAVAQNPPPPYAFDGIVHSDLLDATNAARFVIVTVPQLASSANALAARRQSQGLKSKVVLMDDIHNTFGYGNPSPWNTRTFLAYARDEWAVGPDFVLLAGAGTYDYKDNLGYGAQDPCYVPPVMFSSPFGLETCDNPLADLNGDGLIDLAIGRLNVADTGTFDRVVAKGAAFEAAYGSAWRDKAFFCADNPDIAGDFHATSDTLASRVPASVTITKRYLRPPDPPGVALATVRSQLFSAFNTGSAFVSYMGHGNEAIMADEGIMKTNDIPSLTNQNRAAVMSVMTCKLAGFAAPTLTDIPLGEKLVTAKGGAVALWAPVSESYNAEGTTIGSHYFDAIYADHGVRLGSVVREALRRYRVGSPPFLFLLSTFELLGDPTLVLAPPVFSYETWQPTVFSTGQLADAGVSGLLSNPDGDALVNAAEYAFNTSPTNFNVHPFFTAQPETVVNGDDTNDFVKVEYERRIWRERIEYLVEVSYDLPGGVWSSSSAQVQQVSVTPIDGTMEKVTVRIMPALTPGVTIFVRLKIRILE